MRYFASTCKHESQPHILEIEMRETHSIAILSMCHQSNKSVVHSPHGETSLSFGVPKIPSSTAVTIV